MIQKIKGFLRKFPFLTNFINKLRPDTIKLQQYKRNIKGVDNKIIIPDTSTLVNCKFDIMGTNNQIVLHKKTLFNNVTFYIRGNNNRITIYSYVKFKNGGNIWVENENCQISIGEGTTFEDVHLAATESNSIIKIGCDCMFAYDIDVRTGDSHSILDITSNKRINYAMNVSIGDHVWVASHVSILKGAIIPNNSILATRTVVTKAFDKKNILLGGLPAKIIKTNIDWCRKRI